MKQLLQAMRRSAGIAILAMLTVALGRDSLAADAPDFERDVAPILESRCLRCHDKNHAKGDLVLETRGDAMTADGVVVPGKADESRLVEVISGPKPEMPPKGEPLSAVQVDTLRRWIAAGAPWPEGRTLADKPIHDRAWWSLQSLNPQPPPNQTTFAPTRTVNPIDAFVRAKLSEHGLTASPPANPRLLIRRVTFDLTGLPPTPEDVEEFRSRCSPSLGPSVSPSAPNDGEIERQRDGENTYNAIVDRLLASPHYGERWARHWLDVARFSESQGFERDKMRPDAWHYRDYVIRAFNDDKPYDEFVREQIAGDVLEPVTRERIIATGFLVAGPWDEVGNTQQSNVMKQRVREEELEDIISAVGQTFLGVTIQCARCHAHKFDPITQEDYYSFKAVFEGIRHGGRPLLTPAEQVQWDRDHPRASEEKDKDKKDKSTGPLPPMVYAARAETPPTTFVLQRGDVLSKTTIATARGLSAIQSPAPDLNLSPEAPEAERRRRFAAWLTHPDHPLLARVMVNRVWHYHFGRGLVDTPNDFGANGGRPSHPELLDWLAAEFIGSGWSVKHLQRLIVTSATYRQDSSAEGGARNNEFTKNQELRIPHSIDADNRWLWRFAPRRFEAEAVRDAMLAVSGQLNRQMAGPGFQPFDAFVSNSQFYTFRDKLGPDFDRRTIYRMGIQSLRTPLLDTLDCPDLATKTPVRGETTTPIQALALMNDSFVLRQSGALAARVRGEVGDTLPLQVQRAYYLALGRGPTDDEAQRAERLTSEYGLQELCWVLFNSTEFIYLR